MSSHPSQLTENPRGTRAPDTRAIVFRQPEQLELSRIPLTAPNPEDVVVETAWSGISTGTERLLWTGKMPPFPGMGYPLVPGYETVGKVVEAGPESRLSTGQTVFVPGATCYGEVRGLFGGAASRLVVPGSRALPIEEHLGDKGILLALAATAYHALRPTPDAPLPELIVGHGVLGRLLARLTVALGGQPPVVWESHSGRRTGAEFYDVIDPAEDERHDYRVILDASGDSTLLNALISRLHKGGEIILAGFYSEDLSFSFPPAFMREARFRVAAEWQPADFTEVRELAESGTLPLDELITHRLPVEQAFTGYETAFGDPDCLKMVLDWREENTC
jgi:3-hydroxyethyl bacteriochlorophyllide a dehydrogenase